MKKSIISLFVFQCLVVISGFAQVFNDGAMITIQDGALLHIQGDFTNQGGEITNDGRIELGGDWTNNVSTLPLMPGSGLVALIGTSQEIGGDFPTLFYDLSFRDNQEVTLSNTAGISNQIDLNTGTLILNKNILHLLSPATTTLITNGGGILAETNDAYGYVRWDLGETESNQYEIPFINTFGTSLPLIYDLNSAGQGDGGYILFSNYGSDDDNTPLPIGVNNVVVEGDGSGLAMVDRFWIMEAVDYMNNPGATAGFSFDEVNDIAGANDIALDKLETVIWNDNTGWTILANNEVMNNLVTVNIGQDHSTFSLWSNATSSVSELESFEAFNVFPNPAKDYMNIEFVSTIAENMTISIVDQTGRIITREFYSVQLGQANLNLDLSQFTSGIYTIIVEGEGFRSIAKINKI